MRAQFQACLLAFFHNHCKLKRFVTPEHLINSLSLSLCFLIRRDSRRTQVFKTRGRSLRRGRRSQLIAEAAEGSCVKGPSRRVSPGRVRAPGAARLYRSITRNLCIIQTHRDSHARVACVHAACRTVWSARISSPVFLAASANAMRLGATMQRDATEIGYSYKVAISSSDTHGVTRGVISLARLRPRLA